MTITESIKFNKLKEENEKIKKELAEKDKEINSFKQQIDMAHYFNQNLGNEIEKLKQQQLFKEDFIVHKYCINCRDEEFPFNNKCRTCGWKRIINLKDNSKYDKLPSKDAK